MTTKPALTTWLVLLLVPALVAGGVLFGTWHSDDRLRAVQAAVVNHDEMVEINGQMMPLGRQLAAEIVDSDRIQNVTWVLADTEHAEAGLKTGAYAAVVTIPENFSAAATSFAKPVEEAEQATVAVETSPVVGISETAVGQAVAYAAVNALNGFLTREYLKNVYLGFGEQKKQMLELVDGTRQLADGASQLADGADAAAAGAGQLSDGIGLSANGAGQLADGLDQASAASGQLRSGASRSAAGASQLAGGAGLLADGTAAWARGANTYAGGVQQYAGGVTQLADGLDTYADGAQTYADGVRQYAGGINAVLRPARDAITALPEWGGWLEQVDAWVARAPEYAQQAATFLSDLIAQVRDFVTRADELFGRAGVVSTSVAAASDEVTALAAGQVTCPAELDAAACEAWTAGATAAAHQVQEKLGTAATDAAALAATAGELSPIARQILDALDQAQGYVDRLGAWADELQSSYAALKASIPAGTPLTRAETLAVLDQLVSAGEQLTAGGQQLADGADALAGGARTLADNGTALAGGAQRLADGAGDLSGGMASLSGGTRQLADGLAQLSAGIDLYTGGVDQAAGGAGRLADGLDQLHAGGIKLSGGLGELAGGAGQLAYGTNQLADGIAGGIDQIPDYTDDQAATMATVVAAPVDGDGLAGLVRPGLAWASLLLVLALWLGALATFVVLRPLPADALTSRETDLALLARAAGPGVAIVSAQALLLGLAGAFVVGLTPAASAALVGVLLVAGVAFALVNHALAALFGNPGRIVALAMGLLTTVAAATSAAPPLIGSLGVASTLTPALDAVRAVGVGLSPVIAGLTLAGWALVAGVASFAAVHRRRTVPIAALAQG